MLPSLPSALLAVPGWAFVVAIVGIGIALDAWRAARARALVERWALQNQYRLVSCRRSILSAIGSGLGTVRIAGFRVRGGSYRQRNYVFVVTVADRALGGLSRARVRVRGGAPEVDRDVDVTWDELNAPDESAPPLGAAWEDAQVALLRRVAGGQRAFRPEDRETPEAGERFDMLVEHLMAMQRRGLVHFPTPIGEMRRPGRLYAAVNDVTVTDAGRDLLARTSEPAR